MRVFVEQDGAVFRVLGNADAPGRDADDSCALAPLDTLTWHDRVDDIGDAEAAREWFCNVARLRGWQPVFDSAPFAPGELA